MCRDWEVWGWRIKKKKKKPANSHRVAQIVGFEVAGQAPTHR